MEYRKLRVAWSVTCGVMAVLLCVLWVRSYWWEDAFETMTGVRVRQVHSASGLLLLISVDPSREVPISLSTNKNLAADAQDSIAKYWSIGQRFTSNPISGIVDFQLIEAFKFHRMDLGSSTTMVAIPYTYPVFVVAALAAVPWIFRRRRFSLRTLLITTTLVAVGLGLIVWLR
jgi:hypothetical protein